MSQPLVIGNWKMNGSRTLVAELLQGLRGQEQALSLPGVKVAVCAPYLYVGQVAEALNCSAIAFGAQNVCAESETSGAYTGEVSAAMLADFECRYVIIGHSERRQYYAESDQAINDKIQHVLAQGMVPVLCVGENLSQRQAGEAEQVVAQQLQAVFDALAADMSKLVIAYEPVWAIGTGESATPEQAQAMHQFIRQWLQQRVSDAAKDMALLYGGSVKAGNASELFAEQDIDGALVGGAALDAEGFWRIAEAAGQRV